MTLQELDSDSVLIQEETDEMRTILQRASQRKSELIKSAIKKLAEKYPDQHDQIGNKLVKLWEHLDISKAHILRNVPEKYKRNYTQQEVNKNEVESFFLELSDLMSDISKIYKHWADKVRDDMLADKTKTILIDIHQIHKNAETALIELNKQLSHMRHFTDLKKLISDFRSEALALQNLLDERQKFSTAWKLSLKMIFIWKSYDHVASMLSANKKYGAKWMSKIDGDKTLEQILERTGHCPKCDWDWSVWMERARYNQENGIEQVPKL